MSNEPRGGIYPEEIDDWVNSLVPGQKIRAMTYVWNDRGPQVTIVDCRFIRRYPHIAIVESGKKRFATRITDLYIANRGRRFK